jgi:hypothetical protein
MAASYTLPMLLAEWEALGTTEPFPMAAAGILLGHMNGNAAGAGTYVAGISVCCENDTIPLAGLEHPPQRYKRKNPLKRFVSCSSMLEAEPLGAGTDCVDYQPNVSTLPSGPA